MSYRFENLGDEKFQEFCAALINSEYPNMQAFPIGQPDGGRDAISYDADRKDFAVFQVKYVKNPDSIADLSKWFLEIVSKELPKINTLIPKGATSYYLITNVKGTAHFEAGSIDKMNSLLSGTIGITSWCWWHEDISRKLDAKPLLKWSYPQILDGQDVLNSFVFQYFSENRIRQERVLTAYLKDQHLLDNDVKFRQIDLQIRLLELYTDIPIRIKNFNKKNIALRGVLSRFQRAANGGSSYGLLDANLPLKINAAEFLLDYQVQQAMPKVLLEGGPGQGKSTISQYICQIHRARLLKLDADIKVIPTGLAASPIRIPFKIDLRDVAKWLDKKNPYPDLGDDYFVTHWNKSLENFLLYHIYYHSKIADFTIGDFIGLLDISPVLIVFDGFDEVAGTSIRAEIIEMIDRGVNRLIDSRRTIQILITSRPAAISNDISFPIDMYPHLELTDLTAQVTEEYVEKWIRVKNLTTSAAKEIRTLAKDKLSLPHLRDLAKSPMQLAILLSLLNTRGESLPHKRTALYESYVDLFFNRESEKNVTIRNHRELIIDLHQFLAWTLHSEAELYNNNGRIDIEGLKYRLREYLESERRDTDLVEELFFALQERVCAIVSRTIGTFEFEVQPLREYFCAKYLYRTAPYSTAGASKSGSLPDRFKAIARNYYWQNVVRFFAGCFDRAQLAMLIDEIKELVSDENLRFTNYPRLLTAQLLSDWVFTQYPKYLEPAVAIVVDGLNNHHILNSDHGFRYVDAISVPKECGGMEIERECFRQLANFPKRDYVEELISLIRSNSYNTSFLWEKYLGSFPENLKTNWLLYSQYMGILHELRIELLFDLLNANEEELKRRVKYLTIGNRWDVLDSSIKLKELTLNSILDGEIQISHSRRAPKLYRLLHIFSQPDTLFRIVRSHPTGMSLAQYLIRQSFMDRSYLDTDSEIKDSFDSNVEGFIMTLIALLDQPVSKWNDSIEPWREFVDQGVAYFGERPLFWMVSAIAAGLGFDERDGSFYNDLSDSSKSLCLRVRYARHRSGNVAWWKTRLQDATDLDAVLLILFTWATPKTLFAVRSEVVNYLDTIDIEKLAARLEIATSVSYFNASYRNEVIRNISRYPANNKFNYLVSLRFDQTHRGKFIYQLVEESHDVESFTIPLKLDYLISKFFSSPERRKLDEIKELYAKDGRLSLGRFPLFFRYGFVQNSSKIPYDMAKDIMIECKNLPRALSNAAEVVCRREAGEVITPVGKIAIEEDWFKDL